MLMRLLQFLAVSLCDVWAEEGVPLSVLNVQIIARHVRWAIHHHTITQRSSHCMLRFADVMPPACCSQGLQQGNTTHLNILFHKVTAAAASAARAAYALVSKGLDEHLPFVKQHLTDVSTKAEGLYQKHIGDAAWVGNMHQRTLCHIKTGYLILARAVTRDKGHPDGFGLPHPMTKDDMGGKTCTQAKG